MVRGAVGGRCDHAAGDRNADPMATEDGVEKLPIDWRGQGRGKRKHTDRETGRVGFTPHHERESSWRGLTKINFKRHR